ncbi:hypothetical protein AB4142_33245, partial [Variovorax sp. 2RAF20]
GSFDDEPDDHETGFPAGGQLGFFLRVSGLGVERRIFATAGVRSRFAVSRLCAILMWLVSGNHPEEDDNHHEEGNARRN